MDKIITSLTHYLLNIPEDDYLKTNTEIFNDWGIESGFVIKSPEEVSFLITYISDTIQIIKMAGKTAYDKGANLAQ